MKPSTIPRAPVRRTRLAATRAMLVVGTALVLAGSAFAQNWPNRPIRILLPFAGGTDVVARILAARLSQSLGQQVIPEPRLGAGGNLAHEAVIKAAPDGYTLLMAAPPLVINPHVNPVATFDPVRDLAAVAQVAAIPNVLVVHPLVPARDVRELVALARRAPGRLNYGSGGVGSTPHLAGELFKSLTGTRIEHVPYKSATIALGQAVGGEVDLVFVASSSAVPYVKQGRMRALAVLDTRRVADLPGVPTSAEAGLPQLIAVNWYALMAPRETPRAVIDRLNAEANRAIATPEVRDRLAAMGGETLSGTPDQAAEFIRSEFARWGKLIRETGIRAD
ncbi:MAG: Bug family tripartite tricarboxylate transporter substrate binding protein [Pseudomonadota bacterium]